MSTPRSAVAASLLFATAAAAGDPPQFEVVEMEGIGDFFSISRPADLNDAGVAVGESLDDDLVTRAVVWEAFAPRDLSSDREAPASARGISPGGLVVGWMRNAEDRVEASLWTDGKQSFLGQLPGDFGSRAEDVNDKGVIIGWSASDFGDETAVKWIDGVPLALGDSPSIAIAINADGMIVGWRDTVDGRGATLWIGDTTVELDDLGGGVASGVAISDGGTIVGSALSAKTSKFHAVVWEGPEHEIVDLGLYQDFFPTTATGVNDREQVVGDVTIEVVSGERRAALWQDGAIHLLGDLIPPDSGWILEHAAAINEAGEIIGHGRRDGFTGVRAFRLVPEPQSPLGDLDGDGIVGFSDLLILLAAWGPCGAECDPDLDGDGIVGFADLLLVLSNWG